VPRRGTRLRISAEWGSVKNIQLRWVRKDVGGGEKIGNFGMGNRAQGSNQKKAVKGMPRFLWDREGAENWATAERGKTPKKTG